MKALVMTAGRGALVEREQSALITLLADDDPAVYPVVREKLLSYGPPVKRWLTPHLLSGDPVLRRRARGIIQHFDRQDADNEFVGFCVRHGDDLDLEEGVWLLARTRYPEINIAGYRALLDSFAAELRERLAGASGLNAILGTVNRFLFDGLGFSGDQENYFDPDNSYLNRVLDRRTGNPISLCTLYWLLGRRLRLPLVGIGMPGHFLCRYQTSTDAVFIDVFNRGKLWSRAECIRYLQQTSHGFHESFMAPITPGRTLLRVCSNLHQIHSRLEHKDEMARFQRYLIALAK